MKKNKTVIVASESQGLFTSTRLLTEARKLKYSTAWLNPYQQILSSSDCLSDSSDQIIYFHRTSGTRYDDFDLRVAEHKSLLGQQVTNPLEALKVFRDKDQQCHFLKVHGLPAVPSISYRGELKENYWSEICNLSSEGQYILKMSRGNQGIGVNLINGEKSLRGLLETFHAIKDQRFIIQPYLPHKKEYRIFVIKSDVHAIIERTVAPDDFRGNSKRSSGRLAKKLAPGILNVVERISALSGLDYFGMDVLLYKNDYFVLEINAVPGFAQAEELSGLNIARELLLKVPIKDNQKH